MIFKNKKQRTFSPSFPWNRTVPSYSACVCVHVACCSKCLCMCVSSTHWGAGVPVGGGGLCCQACGNGPSSPPLLSPSSPPSPTLSHSSHPVSHPLSLAHVEMLCVVEGEEGGKKIPHLHPYIDTCAMAIRS